MSKVKVACLALSLVFCLGAAAEATSLNTIISNYGSTDGVTPTIWQDEDRSVFLIPGSNDGNGDLVARAGLPVAGDIALGWYTIQFIDEGNNQVPPGTIKDTSPVSSSDNGSLTDNATGVEGILHALVRSVNTVGSITTIILENYTSATATKYKGSTTAAFGGIVDVYRQDNWTMADVFDGDDASVALPGASDGTKIGVLGDGDGTGTTEFYKISIIAGIGTIYEFAMDFQPGWPNDMPLIIKNDLGTDVYGYGTITANTGEFTGSSQGQFKVIYAPLPTAMWPAAALMLAGFGMYRRRRRNAN